MTASAQGAPRAPLPLYVDDRITGGRHTGDPAGLLHWLLDDAGAARVGAVDDLAKLEPGMLVDVTATACGNPLLALLDFVGPAIAMVLDAAPKGPRLSPRSTGAGLGAALAGGPDEAGASPEEQRILAGIVEMAREGMRTSPVVDTVLITEEGLPVVAVLDRTSAGPAIEALLYDGTYRVLGKVTAVLGADEAINLFRRSMLAAMGPGASSEILAQVEQAGADLELIDPVLEGPLLQLLPVAIFA